MGRQRTCYFYSEWRGCDRPKSKYFRCPDPVLTFLFYITFSFRFFLFLAKRVKRAFWSRVGRMRHTEENGTVLCAHRAPTLPKAATDRLSERQKSLFCVDPNTVGAVPSTSRPCQTFSRPVSLQHESREWSHSKRFTFRVESLEQSFVSQISQISVPSVGLSTWSFHLVSIR